MKLKTIGFFLLVMVLCGCGAIAKTSAAVPTVVLDTSKNTGVPVTAPNQTGGSVAASGVVVPAQDARLALQVAMQSEQSKRFTWITKRGTRSELALPGGWLKVQDACRLPLPDTSWMDAPMSRDDMTRWLDGTT